MKKIRITAELTVDEVLRRWPSSLGFFIKMKLPCVSCPIGALDTLADVAKAHGLAVSSFIRNINQFANKGESS
ncbi:MAG: hypothetical protein A2X94_05505 [Bdellovibrionales bacterium GWB1_55_8]|nr:MAG: hypothetical protein A2X94_05505 [Bdellovibrionales bacterium GWB1_55_8]